MVYFWRLDPTHEKLTHITGQFIVSLNYTESNSSQIMLYIRVSRALVKVQILSLYSWKF